MSSRSHHRGGSGWPHLKIGAVAVSIFLGLVALSLVRLQSSNKSDGGTRRTEPGRYDNSGTDDSLLVDPLDIRSVAPDLEIPALEFLEPGPGKRVKEVIPEFADTAVYHIIYLPVDWQAGKQYPVIVEYAGNGSYHNQFGDTCSGRVEDSKLGYGISAGREFIWVCLPFLNNAGTENAILWWGNPKQYDARPTVEYCKKAVSMICANHGGDPDRVLLTGFSRGAIACNFIGLHDDGIAKLWRGFIPYSHYDGVSNFGLPGLERSAAIARLKRLGDRPQFVCAELGPGRHSVDATQAYLESTDVTGNFTFQTTGFRNHNDSWILRPSSTRDKIRSWVEATLR